MGALASEWGKAQIILCVPGEQKCGNNAGTGFCFACLCCFEVLFKENVMECGGGKEECRSLFSVGTWPTSREIFPCVSCK